VAMGGNLSLEQDPLGTGTVIGLDLPLA